MEVLSGNSDSYYRSAFILLELSDLVANNLVYGVAFIRKTTSPHRSQTINLPRLDY